VQTGRHSRSPVGTRISSGAPHCLQNLTRRSPCQSAPCERKALQAEHKALDASQPARNLREAHCPPKLYFRMRGSSRWANHLRRRCNMLCAVLGALQAVAVAVVGRRTRACPSCSPKISFTRGHAVHYRSQERLRTPHTRSRQLVCYLSRNESHAASGVPCSVMQKRPGTVFSSSCAAHRLIALCDALHIKLFVAI